MKLFQVLIKVLNKFKLMLTKYHSHGKEINLTSDNIEIDSNNFSVDKYGNMYCNDAYINGTIAGSEIVGGSIELTSTSTYPQMIVSTPNYYNTNLMAGVLGLGLIVRKGNDWNNGEDVARITAITYNGEIVGAIELGESNGGGEAPTYITKYDVYSPDVSCFRLTQYSKEDYKKNFEKLSKEEALSIIKDTDIYKYNFKEEDDNEKKHIGFVIGDNYKYSKEITSKDRNGQEIGADTYSMISAAYKVIQMQQEKIEELEQRIEKLEKGDK